MNNVITLKTYPDLIFRNHKEETLAKRIKEAINDFYPEVKLSIEVRIVSGFLPHVNLYLKDFPQKLFSRTLTVREFEQIRRSFNMANYLHSDYKWLRSELCHVVQSCFLTVKPRVMVEAIGRVVEKNLVH